MLPNIFIDTSAFLALEDESDIYLRDMTIFSFTDCVSFVVMWMRGIKEAFAFDEHFNQMGFTRKP